MKSFFLLMLFIPCLGFAFYSDNAKKKKMLLDLDIIKNSLDIKYAPVEWKKHFAGWDLEKQITLAKKEVLSKTPIHVKDFQNIVKKFFKSTRDYHVGVFFYSTEMAVLPFRVQGVDGRYFFTYALLPENRDQEALENPEYGGWIQYLESPPHVGDELLFFNGRPVDDVIQELKAKEYSDPKSKTDQSDAESTLTFRLAMAGHEMPQGNPPTVSLVFKRKETGEEVTYEDLPWIYLPELVKNDFRENVEQDKPERFACFRKQMVEPFYTGSASALKEAVNEFSKKFHQKSQNDEDDDNSLGAMGAKKSEVPPLGEILWESNETYYAYLFKTPEGRCFGYVRIPHYVAFSQAKEFEEIIQKFERETDALVIDQLNNPGGVLTNVYGIASMLTDYPLVVPNHRETITQENALEAIEALLELDQIDSDEQARECIGQEDLGGYVIDREFVENLKEYYTFIFHEWNAGQHLTSPFYLFGIRSIKPHPRTRYTKPILILINQRDFSCADFFPAILQDNHRAVLFGTQTAGAGGCVIGDHFFNHAGIKGFSLTASFAERLNHQPIENLGVTPDVPYEVSIDDLQNNYEEYRQAVLKALQGLVD